MTKRELLQRRLVNLGIASGYPVPGKPGQLAAPEDPVRALPGIVSRLGAMQAQDYPGTVWAMGLRLPGSKLADIEKVVESATIVRTWPMRGTLHFVAASDLRWMLGLLAPKVIAGTKSRQQNLELDADQFSRSQETMRRVLSGGQLLGRDALLAAVEADGISTAGGRGYH